MKILGYLRSLAGASLALYDQHLVLPDGRDEVVLEWEDGKAALGLLNLGPLLFRFAHVLLFKRGGVLTL